MPRIAWIEDADAQGQLAELFAAVRSQFQGRVPDIVRAMSPRPDFLAAIMGAPGCTFRRERSPAPNMR